MARVQLRELTVSNDTSTEAEEYLLLGAPTKQCLIKTILNVYSSDAVCVD
jgi:hypothetical protein